VTGRASVFSDQRVIELLNESFVPVAVDINHVIRQKDSEGDFFRHIAEQGHYAGRTKPTATRQGLYVVGVDGNLVDSLNSTRVETVLKLIKRSTAKWNRRNASDRRLLESNSPDARYAVQFPEGGMILRQTMRDLPNASNRKQNLDRHNFDHAWLSAEQASHFSPSESKVGHQWSIPESIVKKLAAYHMIDQVRGESWPFDLEQVKLAELSAEVVAVKGSKGTVRMSGRVKNLKPATGQRNPFNKRTVDQDIVLELKLGGWLVYDSNAKRFDSLKLLAAGQRSGSDVYNFRWNDLGPSPIGFTFEMIEDVPENRIRPKFAGAAAY